MSADILYDPRLNGPPYRKGSCRMKTYTLGDPKPCNSEGFEHVLSIAGNILGLECVEDRKFGSYETILIVDETGSRCRVVATSMMGDLKHFIRSLEGIDSAPFVTLEYVGVEKSSGDRQISRIAWEFDAAKAKPKSQLFPKSPESFGVSRIDRLEAFRRQDLEDLRQVDGDEVK